jgi:uncharacterized protein (TIGR02646 family)
MRWIDRGPEPGGLNNYRLICTQDWIDYFNRRTGDEPPAHWGRFRGELGHRFGNKCGYCERQCDVEADDSNRVPTLDHFRPRSLFPELTYEWSNWIFSCRQCNVDHKQDKWLSGGYVDPCASDPLERPEMYFDYDDATGEIIPKSDLEPTALCKVNRTISDLRLNALNIRWARLDWVDHLKEQMAGLPFSEWPTVIERYTEPSTEFSGVINMFLRQYALKAACSRCT